MHVLQAIYFSFRQHQKTSEQIYGRDTGFQWTPEVDDAFQTLMGALCAATILAYPKPGERFIVDTDASNFGIGGVLSQVQDR
jgi:hypothetical protein